MTYFYGLIFLIIWIVNFLNGTGIGNAYQTTEIFKTIVVFVGIINLLIDFSKKRTITVNKKIFNSYFLMILFFFISSLLSGYLKRTLDFLWVYILVYLISKIPISHKLIKTIGSWYILMGLVVLFLFNYTSIFSGWNGNTIGMTVMYSYLFYLLKGFKTYSFKNISFLIILTMVYLTLLYPTDSRSSILFSIIGLLYTLGLLSDKLINKKYSILLLLLLPLFISLITITISNIPNVYDPLNTWSIKNFEKPIFNGRNDLYLQGLRLLSNNILFGCGNILHSSWHNSAIHVLATYGILGYLAWISSYFHTLNKTIHSQNKLLKSSVIMFLLVYVHQSVELGFIITNPNILPYVMFGVIISILKRRRV